jgi:hypothetical protein
VTYAFITLAVCFLFHIRVSRLDAKGHADQVSLMQQQHTHHLNLLIQQKNPDLEQLIALVDRQMQRIQAPAQAVIDHSMTSMVHESPETIPMDDDEAYWDQKSVISKEDFAEAAFAAEKAMSVAS